MQVGAQSLLFDRITTADGLAGDEVFCLLEDRDGYIWAGTGTGLSRLEGTRIRNFFHDPGDSTSLGHDQVNSIAQDANGTLWMATMSGLSRFDGARGDFRTYRIPATGTKAVQANRMRQVVAIGDSLAWVLTEDGLYRFNTRTGLFISVQGKAPGEGPAGHCHARNALHWEAARLVLWAATRDGIAAWDARSDAWSDWRDPALPGPWSVRGEVTAPCARGDTIWFHADEGFTLWAFDRSSRTLVQQAPLSKGNSRFNLQWQAFDADGGHWVATWTKRLFHRAPGGAWTELIASASEPGTLPTTSCPFFMTARNGDRWLATSQGIAVAHAGQPTTVLLPHQFSGGQVLDMLPMGNDPLLIGTTNGLWLVSLADPYAPARHLPFTGAAEHATLAMNHVRHLTRCADGRVALSTGSGLHWLDPHALVPRPDPRFGGSSWAFTFLAEAEDARWAGTWASGLWRCPVDEQQPCTRIDTAEGPYGRLPSRMLLCWLSDSKGRHWVGMNNGGGIAVLENGQWRGVMDERGANVGGVVRVMAEAPDGSIWLGTHEQGIVVHDPETGRNRFVTRRDGVPGARIMALHFTRDGTLWVVADMGIARMPPGARAFIPFNLIDGLNERGAANAMAELPDGRLVFGAKDKILLHDPRVPSQAREAPHAMITGYRVRDAAFFGAPPHLELTAASKALTLELGATGAALGAPLLFRYRVMPMDTAWHVIGAAQRIDLFDLPSGMHVIEIGASSDGRLWHPDPAVASVRVLPPFYATWWFRSAAALSIVLIVLIGFRLYLAARLREQRETFEREQALLAERMRIADDMHDDLGAGLSGLKLRIEMAVRVEQDPARRQQLSAMAQGAGELISSMRQIIWAMSADQGSIGALAAYASSYARNYCQQHGLTISVQQDPALPDAPLTGEQRRNCFLVIKEALHNVVKHAHASQVRLCLRWNAGLEITIEDNGLGLPKHAQEGSGNGLRSMQRRMSSIGGSIVQRNGEPARGELPGASIHLHLPIAHP
jgi:signal transduction histidine kinase/ligand-binding sensor domain-containing protein